MKVQNYPNPVPPRKTPPEKEKEEHGLHDGLQLGHNASSLGEATGILGEISREEMVEMRSLVARESRQAAILGENSAPHTLLRSGAVGLNALVDAGAVYHAVEHFQEKGAVNKLEGVSHLLMGAGCGLTAAHLSTGGEQLGHTAGHFLLAHGAIEMGVGVYRAVKGEKTLGLLQAAHGACLVGAEMAPGAALPLCVAMAALTGVQVWQHRVQSKSHSGPAHK